MSDVVKTSVGGEGSERSSFTHNSLNSRKSRSSDHEDPLLKTIKAQHSLSRQMTDEMSEASALLSPSTTKVGGNSGSQGVTSETEF